ncbi:MAG: VCBS repeat-containing protein, partial [Planctomycetes bacterium]|nr:VCBS repeat-containing protein [Planctomycetota bacterium]
DSPTPGAPRGDGRSRRTFLLAAALAIAGLVLLAVVWGVRNGDRDEPAPPTDGEGLSLKRCRELLELKHLAVGRLENEQAVQANELLTRLAEELPEEPLPARNLAIARLMSLESGQIEAASARQAVDRLLEIEPESAAAHYLAAKVALAERTQAVSPEEAEEHLSRALAMLEKAAELAPESAFVPYAMYAAARDAEDPQVQARGRQALGEAYRLAPQNLFLLADWLLAQAEAQDPEMVATLEAAKEAVQPIEAGIRQRTRVELSDFLDKAEAAVERGAWSEAMSNLRIAANLIRPEDFAQSDRRRIAPHPLEFVLHQFSESFCSEHRPLTGPAADAIPVTLRAIPLEGPIGEVEDAKVARLPDVDLDGKPDIAVLRDASLEIYSRGDDGAWRLAASAPVPEGMTGLLTADLDRDTQGQAIDPQETDPTNASPRCHEATPDFVAYGPAGVRVFRTVLDSATGEISLEAVEQAPELASAATTAAELADFDHDGDLDLILATDAGIQLWAFVGDMQFAQTGAGSTGVPENERFTAMTAVDWDRDVDLDILLAGPDAPLGYLENLRHGELRWRNFDEPFHPLQSATALAVAETDGNVSWDMIAAGEPGVRLARSITPQPGVVQLLEMAALTQQPAAGVRTWDYDNDGHRDLVVWSESGVQVLRGGPLGEFEVAEVFAGPVPPQVRDVAVGDLDGDGDQDLVVAAGNGLHAFDNDGGNRHHWIDVRLRGQDDAQSGRMNRYGIGALMELKAGPMYQAQVVSEQTTHFGLGERAQADVVRVVWTNGVPQTVLEPQAGQTICERMTLKGSCPYVYTWNGRRYEFFTDLLWAAPLGLQFAEGVIAPDRPWEYLKIEGEKLQADDGRYRLQVTEELWEAGYFDRVELIAVDHPADVEIFSNEKVGPAEIAAFQVHTVRQRRRPVAARDQQGRDVLSQVAERDGDYLKGFDRTFRQGLAEPHYLELDLGALDDPQRIVLFLTGWIYPTDTSLNIALAQDEGLDAPRPPSLWVPDAEGRWREAMPYMGFPGGKTKTIAVDLSGAFLADDYRVRIQTTAQIYWDEAFFTVDEKPAPLRLTPLELTTAHLYHRGFSQPLPKRANSPEVYDFHKVSQTPRWPPMQGRFTRYGDVRPLLTATDDLLVVMGAGDALELEFAAPEAPPAGWRRDFLLHNVGWDKDADLNTVYGQTVEPLPFTAMPSYPYPTDAYPDTPRHRDYLRRYQIREQVPAQFWKGLRGGSAYDDRAR